MQEYRHKKLEHHLIPYVWFHGKGKTLGPKIWNGWLLSLGLSGGRLTTKVYEGQLGDDVTALYVEYGGSYMNIHIFQDH